MRAILLASAMKSDGCDELLTVLYAAQLIFSSELLRPISRPFQKSDSVIDDVLSNLIGMCNVGGGVSLSKGPASISL